MFVIACDDVVSYVVRYRTAREAKRAIHELVEEVFGLDGDPEDYIAARDRYSVVAI